MHDLLNQGTFVHIIEKLHVDMIGTVAATHVCYRLVEMIEGAIA
jgi:hypothetical protein